MLVMKFGGTSVGQAERILQLTEIVKQAGQQKPIVVVVSAMSGITNLLEEACDMASRQDEGFKLVVDKIANRHDQCIGAMPLSAAISSNLIQAIREPLIRLGEICKGLFLIGDLTPKTKAHIMSYGELLSSRIVQAAFEHSGVKATWLDSRKLIVTDDSYLSANVDFAITNTRIQEAITSSDGIYIAPGYIARSLAGEPTTLGRGGSDYTAAIFAGALAADTLEIWTDVNGMLSADPRMVRDTITIPVMSYEEAMELSYFGAKVIYPPTILPALRHNVPIAIRNSFNPSHPGTLITRQVPDSAYYVKGLTSIQNIALITLTGAGMAGTSTMAHTLFETLHESGITLLFITQSSSEHTISFAVHSDQADRTMRQLENAFHYEIAQNRIANPTVEKELSLVAVVGDGMRERSGVAGKIFSLLGENGINIRAIAQGSTERNVSFVIRQLHLAKALNILHEGFFLSKYKTIHLFVLGAGNVGATLIQQLQEAQQKFLAAGHLHIKVCGLANSKKMLIDEQGISLDHWQEQLQARGIDLHLQTFGESIKEANLRNSILIDVTASEVVSQIYADMLSHNIHVVTANKIAASAAYPEYQHIKQLSARHQVRFLNETNVGAGLPVIKTIRDLVLTGDRVHRIQAVLSGSLNYIFDRIGSEGTMFSLAVNAAREKGYTEPNPSLDLSGKDVMRKILILARETGLKLEMSDIENKSFLSDHLLAAADWETLYSNLQMLDADMESERMRLAGEKKRWRYMASLENGHVTTGLEEIDETHPAYHLQGTDNMILIWTDRYKERPMIIAGAGAGPDVTASGVLADVISIANV